jgi:thiol-disulfide isomerase/thioredoxin
MKKSLLLLLAALLVLPVQAADFTPLNKLTAAQLLDPASHRQPTIVALWSSDCSHCKKNLELLSTLVKSNKQLRVITVAAETDSAILGPLLDRYHLPGPRYAYGNDNPDAIAYAIDPNWSGELPRTFLFNGAGRKEKVSGVISAQFAEKALGLRF